MANTLVSKLKTTDPWRDIPARNKVWVYNPNVGIVTGLVPESFRLSVNNAYQRSPLYDALSRINTAAISAQELLARGGTVDFSVMLKELKRKQWSGGGPLTTSFSLVYINRGRARWDVVEPVKELIRLSTASSFASASAEVRGRTYSATVVNPPEPVDVAFGKIMHFKKALIVNINWQYSNIVDSDGHPTFAVVNLGLETKTMFVHDAKDVTFSGDTIVKQPELST